VDARDERGHDESEFVTFGMIYAKCGAPIDTTMDICRRDFSTKYSMPSGLGTAPTKCD
jgi:hypothetical protein